MSENLEANINDPVNPEELAEVIVEFEQYRDRLYRETMDAAQKAKLSKKATLEKLEPELAKLDAVIEQLRAQQATLTASN
jgi:uncharacterized membrane protein YebE (DUF533 family)